MDISTVYDLGLSALNIVRMQWRLNRVSLFVNPPVSPVGKGWRIRKTIANVYVDIHVLFICSSRGVELKNSLFLARPFRGCVHALRMLCVNTTRPRPRHERRTTNQQLMLP